MTARAPVFAVELRRFREETPIPHAAAGVAAPPTETPVHSLRPLLVLNMFNLTLQG